jgi:hypothetical protein
MRRLPLLAALVLLCAAAPAQGKALKSLWGPLTLPNGKSAGPTYRSLGVDVLQMGANWDAMEPARPANPRDPADPAYQWSTEIDDAVALGRKYHFSVAVLVRGTPNWANGGRGPNWAPAKSKDFADFLYAASKRYPGVKRWMIWGEPNRRDNFNPMPTNSPAGPRRYARLLDAAYGALKRANRRNIVIGGMTFTAGDVVPRDFVKWARLPNGKPPRLDRWGHNPFSTRMPNLSLDPFSDGNYDFSDMDTLYAKVHAAYRRAYPRFRRSGPSIWVSEFTIQADHGSQDFNFYVSSRDQGKWIAAAFKQANKTRYINDVGWLGLLDEPVADYNRTTGLLKYDLSRKPAYYAFKRAP